MGTTGTARTHTGGDYIIIISETEEQVKIDLNVLVMHMTYRRWLINPAMVQGVAQTVKFWGISWAGGTQDIPQATENKLPSLPTPRTK